MNYQFMAGFQVGQGKLEAFMDDFKSRFRVLNFEIISHNEEWIWVRIEFERMGEIQ